MRPRILYVVPYKVTPADTGPKQYFRALINYAQLEYDCEVFQFELPSEASRDQKLEVKSLPAECLSSATTTTTASSPCGIGIALSRYGLLSLAPYSSSSVGDAFASLLRQRRYDIVHFLSFHVLPLRRHVPSNSRTILTAYNAFSLGNYRTHSVLPMTKVVQRIKYYWIAKSFSRLERRYYRNFDIVSTVSEPDTNYLRETVPGLDVQTVIIPVEEKFLIEPRRVTEPNNRILVMGQFGHEGIAEGALDFLRATPDIPTSLEVVLWSRTFSRSIRREAKKWTSLSLMGYVDSYIDFLDTATICVFPQRCDSGTQVKVQQAMARGIPVIATPEVLAGVQAKAGVHALVYRNRSELRSAMLCLLQNREAAARMGAQARAHIATTYTVRRMGSQLDSLYSQILN